MDDSNHNMPIEIAVLLVGYFHHTLTPQEHDNLDEWLKDSDENIDVFEKCLEMTLRLPIMNTELEIDDNGGNNSPSLN